MTSHCVSELAIWMIQESKAGRIVCKPWLLLSFLLDAKCRRQMIMSFVRARGSGENVLYGDLGGLQFPKGERLLVRILTALCRTKNNVIFIRARRRVKVNLKERDCLIP